MIDASDASGSTDEESNGAAAPSMGAILLAGGRGTRLDGVDKPLLMIDGDSLLNRTIDAAVAMGGVRPITIVGPDRPGAFTPEDSPAPLQRVREDPPYGGPAAAVIAALEAWRENCSELPHWTIVLACDLVDPASAVARLHEALAALIVSRARADGIHLTDRDGRAQWLMACYRTSALVRAARATPARGAGTSMRALIGPLDLIALPPAPEESGPLDIDTWDDLRRAGAHAPVTAPATSTAPSKETP